MKETIVKIKYQGIGAVDIDGHDGVNPGDTVDVSDELAARLCANGDWTVAKKNTTEPADAGKES